MKTGRGKRNAGRTKRDPERAIGGSDGGTGDAGISRRTMLEIVAVASLATACDNSPAIVARARQAAQAASEARANGGAPLAPRFFTPHEWDTVRVLVDIIIPRDERSGSATEAGVPEYMDFTLGENPDDALPIRGGLAWLDHECDTRFGRTFLACADAERTQVLDDIAWPRRAKPGFSQGVEFFNRFRDLTASGFYSSRMGVADLQYLGNVVVPEWKGCPPAALAKLGVG